ncbi:hypothetical protein GGTG_05145 [Gaeumannomyces tritici R3-111a-1]|uniref:Uncharacterized protein n=1 Tax=Gaeumannomyces tritici (strain R3-111a-1) TaxID=644352 RepID=J3NV33_GAET3|nr:hypothetical protein GGTG_05145 [Gaeumannomyces tritici R3-111a-1]EJT75208.1 hypothetical protein GGTG_05145 [Gaeumannomyces tritici R3-111a-1]
MATSLAASRALYQRQVRHLFVLYLHVIAAYCMAGSPRGNGGVRTVHTTIFSGGTFLQYWLRPAAARAFPELFRVNQSTFRALYDLLITHTQLAGSKHVSSHEKVASFLYICGQDASLRAAAHLFGRSPDTTRRNFHEVLRAMMRLHVAFVTLPDVSDVVWPDCRRQEVQEAFAGCLGAVDGTLINAKVAAEEGVVWRSRKGPTAQNVMAAVDHRGRFVSVTAGIEGLVHDSQAFREALARGFVVPGGYYYVGDAGFGLGQGVITPYGATKYHLQEQGFARPETPEELFNLHHAKIRVRVERSFGELKNRWKIVRGPGPSYSIRTQISIVLAVTALQNFIWEREFRASPASNPGFKPITNAGGNALERSRVWREAVARAQQIGTTQASWIQYRTWIARRLWQDYQVYRAREDTQ